MAKINLYGGNNSLEAEVKGLRAKSSGDYVNDATVSITLKDEDGVDVTGVTFPVSLSYVSGSDGIYRGIISDTSNLITGSKYQVIILAEDFAGNKAEWISNAIAKDRRL